MVVCSPEKMQAVLKRQTFDTGERRLRTAQSSLFVVVAHSPPIRFVNCSRPGSDTAASQRTAVE